MPVNNAIVCPSLTIPNAGSVSNALTIDEVFSDAEAFTLFAPATLDAGTFTIEVNDRAGGTFVTLNSGTADVQAPAASKACIYPAPNFYSFRIRSSGAVAADRTWRVVKTVTLEF
jgi:hypothetical protein